MMSITQGTTTKHVTNKIQTLDTQKDRGCTGRERERERERERRDRKERECPLSSPFSSTDGPPWPCAGSQHHHFLLYLRHSTIKMSNREQVHRLWRECLAPIQYENTAQIPH